MTDRPSPVRVATWNLWWRFGPWEQRRPTIAAVLAPGCLVPPVLLHRTVKSRH